MTEPMVSIGMPLYRSTRYLDIITRNVEALDRPDVEILFSDRHGDDDALERIAARFPGDRRLRFLAATDRRGWIDNYNFLLAQATGKYFGWMSHDDEYPRGLVAALVECLEADPETISAYPAIELIDENGRARAWRPEADVLLREGEAWSPRAALRHLVFRSNFEIAGKGLFRREPVVRNGLFLRAPLDGVWTDIYWVFALGLLGRPRFVASAPPIRKRMHAASASAGWAKPRLRDVASGHAVLCSYIRDFAPSLTTAAMATMTVSLWSLARAIASAPDAWPVPLRGRAVARRLLARVLKAPIHFRPRRRAR